MMECRYILGVVAAMGVVTFGLRALPFVAGRWLAKHPLVHKLGAFLPLTIMTLLLLNTVVGAATEHSGGPWMEISAVAVVAVLQWFIRNALLSILLGTCLYAVLRNVMV